MKRRSWFVITGAAALALNIAAFKAGRQVAASNDRAVEWNQQSTGSIDSSRAVTTRSDGTDLTNARIENIGTLGFEQAFDLVCDAGPELRQKWARDLDALPFTSQRRAAIPAFYRIMVQLNPEEAASLAMQSKVGNSVAAIMINAAPDRAFPFLGEMAVKFARNWPPPVVELIGRWSRVDPLGASQFLDSHPEKAEENELYLLLANWSAIDFNSAKAWLDGRPANQQNAYAMRGLLTGWAMSDRHAASEFLIAHANEEKFQGAFEEVSKYLFRTAPDEARAFVFRLPNDEIKHGAIRNMLDFGMLYSSSFWKFSPAVKTAWLGSLPPDLSREHLSDMGEAWRDGDAADFRAWADSMPRDRRDLAVSGYCKAAIYQDNFSDVITSGSNCL